MDKNIIISNNSNKNINSKTLKEYFNAEREMKIDTKIESLNRNNFRALLNKLELKNVRSVDNKRNILSPYIKYFALISAPVAMAMFGFLFLNINKIQSNPEAKVAIESQDMNLAMSQQSDVEASEISDISMMSASVMLKSAVQEEVLTLKPENIEIYKNEVLNLIADLKDFEESLNIEI